MLTRLTLAIMGTEGWGILRGIGKRLDSNGRFSHFSGSRPSELFAGYWSVAGSSSAYAMAWSRFIARPSAQAVSKFTVSSRSRAAAW